MLFSSLIVGILSLGLVNSFECPGITKKNITFKNTNVTVEDLWQARIMTPGYTSQMATNYAAYVFMYIKLGINVTFYPYPSTPQWYSSWTESSTNTSYSYPNFYWDFIQDDEVDLHFEAWPTQGVIAGESSYYSAGTVEKGVNGIFGEVGWFVPKYFVDMYPTVLVPNELATNTAIREALINGSSGYINNGTNYYEMYNDRSRTTQFDWPNRTINGELTPIVWGSAESYMQSAYSWNLTRSLELNISFVALGGEGSLASLVEDLYSAGAPFIANIYIPDDNFATMSNKTTKEFQSFEKIALPFNSAQSVDTDCFRSSTCQLPFEAIKKIKNPMIDERFPEVGTFWNGFELNAQQLALLTAYYKTIPSSSGLTEHEKWINASCAWLSDPDSESTWNVEGWLVDIDRYDCVPGCGVMASDGITYVGGHCDYYNSNNNYENGTCVCDNILLDGDRCDESCPGLGVTMNSSNNYVLEFCSGHGSCNEINKLCTCDDGWGNNDCGTKFSTYKFDIGLGGFLIACSCIIAIVGCLCIAWLRMNATYKTVKALSVDMTSIMTVGLIMIAMSNTSLVVETTDASCISWIWLFGLGGIMAIMSPLLKAYRVSRVFHGGKMLRAVKITDRMLMKILLKAVLLQVILCVSYSILHQVEGGTEIYFNNEELRKETRCNQSPMTQYISLGSYAYFFIMLCALTYYSYGTRRALSVFKESTCAYFSSFLSLFCTLIVFGFSAVTDDPFVEATVQGLAVIIVLIGVFSLFYATRIYTFFTEPENRNVTDGRSIQSTNTTSTTANFSNVSQPKPGPQNA